MTLQQKEKALWKLSDPDTNGHLNIERGVKTGEKENKYTPKLKDLSDSDIRSIRNALTGYLKPACEDYHATLSKNTIACFKYVVNLDPSKFVLRRLAYSADRNELAVTNGYILMLQTFEKPLFDKTGTFDILKAGNKETKVRELVWMDDDVKFPDYTKVWPNYEDTLEWKENPLSLSSLAIIKALYDGTDHKSEFGYFVMGESSSFYIPDRRDVTEMKVGINFHGFEDLIFDIRWLYHALLFLSEENQRFLIRRGNEVQPIILETENKRRKVMLMPIKPW